MTLFATNMFLVRATGFWQRADPRRGRLAALGQRCYFYLNVTCNVMFILTKLIYTFLDTDSLRNITENISDVLCIAFSLLQLLRLISAEAGLVDITQRVSERASDQATPPRPSPPRCLLWPRVFSYLIYFFLSD